MKLLGIIIFILVSNILLSQEAVYLKNRQDSIKLLVNLIEKDGYVSSSNVGAAGMPSKQYYRFVFLLTLMNNKEFVQLVKNSTGCLRVYAYIGLYRNKYNKLKDIEILLKNDSTIVSTKSGCSVESLPISNVISRIRDWYWEEYTNDIFASLIADREYREIQFRNIGNSED